MAANRSQKHPCPDCFFCQWCAEERCVACMGKRYEPIVAPPVPNGVVSSEPGSTGPKECSGRCKNLGDV